MLTAKTAALLGVSGLVGSATTSGSGSLSTGGSWQTIQIRFLTSAAPSPAA